MDGVALVYVLFDALGSPVPTQAWDPLFAAPLTVDGYLPSPAVGRSLDEASRSGRVGETVLLALIALGDAGAEGADAATLFDVITALRRIGLGDEARAHRAGSGPGPGALALAVAPAAARGRASVSRHTEAFLEMMAAERGAAGSTLLGYSRDLEDFSAFMASRGGPPEEASSDGIRAYLSALTKRGLSRSTAARRLSCLRQFFRFLVADGRRGDDPTAVIEGAPARRRLPRVLSEREVERMLEAAGQRSGKGVLRLVALVELLYATGMRVSELVSLPRAAMRGDPRFLTVRGKGGRERLVPLNDAAIDATPRLPRRRAGTDERGGAIALAFPLARPWRPPDGAPFRPDAEGFGHCGGA